MDFGHGRWGTHRMAYSTGTPNIVYPTIVQDPISGNLKQLNDDEAVDYAKKTGEFIPFDKPEDAAWFGRSYKKVWGGEW